MQHESTELCERKPVYGTHEKENFNGGESPSKKKRSRDSTVQIVHDLHDSEQKNQHDIESSAHLNIVAVATVASQDEEGIEQESFNDTVYLETVEIKQESLNETVYFEAEDFHNEQSPNDTKKRVKCMN